MSNVIDINVNKNSLQKSREMFLNKLDKFVIDSVNSDPNPEFTLVEAMPLLVRLACDIIETNDEAPIDFNLILCKAMQQQFEDVWVDIMTNNVKDGNDDDAA